MRDQFEKLPEIAASMSQHIYFGEDSLYHSDLHNFQMLVCWLNGAWYAYQEQQKKIDKLSCNHLWTGKSENQYCSKCGEVD